MIRSLTKATVGAAIVMMAVALVLSSACSRLVDSQLREAACNGETEKAAEFLKQGARVNATDSLGNSALIFVEACTKHDDLVKSRAPLVQLLIAKGAEVNHQDRDGFTALMYAARNGDTQAVNALLSSGALVNVADKNGETALIKAAASSCTEETVRALLSAGADLSARDHNGRNALEAFRSSNACPKSNVGELLDTEAQKRK